MFLKFSVISFRARRRWHSANAPAETVSVSRSLKAPMPRRLDAPSSQRPSSQRLDASTHRRLDIRVSAPRRFDALAASTPGVPSLFFLRASLRPSPSSPFLPPCFFLREILQPPPFTSAAAANSREAAVRRLRVIQKDSKYVGIACGSKRRGLFSFY